ncbi:MAG TPA: multifunctional oxoglutarate decarboxylase/oxoglutarate dehydrogenase thiamine pyrophosphate-binding subunit/dihydrolipoyllysine-residue succinyltransferase subunit [Nitriliruptorales bacterium]|nr:multifunctional oxoglutarate decarboxylase/oxoglutarate dehydrogenase thiamine pyrophosphate-binding subunit/dihydrolipoyllysine-residue succinyltransferase subunit [Nitriliruptorales bacterium]
MADGRTSRTGAEGFGVNAWLVDELYEQYREDPDALSESWQEFFEDYRPEDRPQPPRDDQPAVQTTADDRDALRARAKSAAAGDGQAAEEASPEDAEHAAARTAERGQEGRRPEAAETARGAEQPAAERLRGIKARIAENMATSLSVPTATSVRTVPAKLLEVNRSIANNYLRRTYGGKVSFTHIISYAAVKALDAVPNMRTVYAEVDSRPGALRLEHVNLGLAVDVERDGERVLLVPSIKQADTLAFDAFLEAYEDLIRKVRTNRLTPDDFRDTTMTITNPGTLGTVLSVPRLMQGQSVILGVGAIDYPVEYQAADPATLAKLGVSKQIALSSTYDHRVIQGAESGSWLARIHALLLGEDGYYDDIFQTLGVPYEPARWRRDTSPLDSELAMLDKQVQVDQLAHMYRVRGHLIADLDPLSQKPPRMHSELDPITYGLSIWDLDREFVANVAGQRSMQLGQLLGILRDAYCRTVGIEYMHIQDPAQKRWIQEQVEGVEWELAPEDKRHVLERLNAAEAFERFLHTKYLGHKRFSLEGGESFIPLLDAILEDASTVHIEEVVMGMAHRGRLNVLANIVGKSYREIFSEFEGDIDPQTVQGSGDVKYHVGQTGVFRSRTGGEVRITLPSNPSHLEAVDPVVEGIARARQDLLDVPETFRVLPVLVHGDAAFAGQGVVAEVFNLSQLRGYRTGGTIHIVVNNQLGFTTPPEAGRSSEYSTDIARAVQAPIIHVNGDDPEAVVRVGRLAFAYRQQFHRDVVIDLVCYRKLGHNEADDPSYTQPLMYETIDQKRSARKIYTERLVKRGDISMNEAEELLDDFQQRLDEAFERTKESHPPATPPVHRPPPPRGVAPSVETGVKKDVLDRIVDTIFGEPEGFTMHPKLKRLFDRAADRYREEGRVDWPLAEQLAFGSLLGERTWVRLAGQDSRRGTFSQRHAVLVDYETGEEYTPLAHLADEQGKFFIYDSLLSEYAAVGFEYGYSVANKEALTIWEAQFGDFVNGAQIVIDQFIVAAEDKWGQTSSLVMLLPHGYEGQGPEHSSARIERFLVLAAEDNIQVCNATTAAQYFHLLRRQKHRGGHEPLIIFTPKSLLRSKHSASPVEDLTTGRFHETIDDPNVAGRDAVERVILCSGKVAFEAMQRRDELSAPVAVVRVEQLYPWPAEQLAEILDGYPNAHQVLWLQEEPENMGPWPFAHSRLHRLLRERDRQLTHVSRPESASPAAGSHTIHQQEQEQLLRRAFDGL